MSDSESTFKIPPSERALQGNGEHTLGLCDECKRPIKYAPIKHPTSCQEIEADEFGRPNFSVEYVSLHASCAFQRMITSRLVDYYVNISVIGKNRLFEWLLKKLIKKIETKLEVEAMPQKEQTTLKE
jgi:hypothetical protein